VARSGGQFRVEILRQRVARPTPSEARALGLPAGRRALIREVILRGRSAPWVFARSIIPLATLTGPQRRLRQLDDRPLGQVLFSDNSMRRGPVAVARVAGATLPTPVTAPGTGLWGRRSVFYLDGKPLLVAEIFLPAFTP
jgi:chorismate--pyruvate lyase